MYHRKPHSWLAAWIAIAGLIGLLVWASLATASACSAPQNPPLVVGTNTPFPPFETRYGEDVVGFDIDLARRIAKELGRPLLVKDFNEFDALLPALSAGKLDMVISAVTIRADRDEVVDFSESYFKASQAILASAAESFSYTGNPQELSGKRIGYQEGTTSQFWVEDNLAGKVAVASLAAFGDVSVGLKMLELGALDLIIIDEPVARALAKSNQKLEVAGVIETGEQYGMAVQEGDPHGLLPTVNAVLAEMKERGDYEKLIEQWFGGAEK